jgi:hypothetical protein
VRIPTATIVPTTITHVATGTSPGSAESWSVTALATAATTVNGTAARRERKYDASTPIHA